MSYPTVTNTIDLIDKIDRLEVGARGRKSSSRDDYMKLRKALCVGNANQVAERMLRHNGYRTLTFRPQLVQVLTSQTKSSLSVLYWNSDNVGFFITSLTQIYS